MLVLRFLVVCLGLIDFRSSVGLRSFDISEMDVNGGKTSLTFRPKST